MHHHNEDDPHQDISDNFYFPWQNYPMATTDSYSKDQDIISLDADLFHKFR
jgi:hypothetical protein